MFEIAIRSDQGRVRLKNQDVAFADTGVLLGDEYALLAVADGMGGHLAGEVASRMAIDCFSRQFKLACQQASEPLLALELAVRRANQQIYQRAEGDYRVTGMGTTLTVALLWRAQLLIAHVGDSRAYLYREGSCQQLTDDHSLVGELMKSGSLSEQEAQKHPNRNLLIRALGTDAVVDVDLLTFSLQTGDVVLLCSDGLSSELDHVELACIIRDQRSLEQAADLMTETANARGGRDNITAVLARWGCE